MIHRDTEVNHLYTLNFCEIFANLKKMPKTMYSGQSHCINNDGTKQRKVVTESQINFRIFHFCKFRLH